jgi:hypothetical protein
MVIIFLKITILTNDRQFGLSILASPSHEFTAIYQVERLANGNINNLTTFLYVYILLRSNIFILRQAPSNVYVTFIQGVAKRCRLSWALG